MGERTERGLGRAAGLPLAALVVLLAACTAPAAHPRAAPTTAPPPSAVASPPRPITPTTATRTSSSTIAPTTARPATTAPRVAPTTTRTAPATRPPQPPSAAARARAELAHLAVAWPSDDGVPYRRAAFSDGWDYDRATGCNVRDLVLIAESLVPVVKTGRCKIVSGRWVSLYDGVVTTDPHDLQIDHLIPLGDAWTAGAERWTAERRHRFAEDLTSPETLIAVTSRTNEAKSDDTPDEWLPPAHSAWCTYAARWVDVKVRWGLSATPSEAATLRSILARC